MLRNVQYGDDSMMGRPVQYRDLVTVRDCEMKGENLAATFGQ